MGEIEQKKNNFLSIVNDSLQVNAEKASEEMNDAVTVAHTCILKLSDMLNQEAIPSHYNQITGELVYIPLNPQSVKQIADANNTALTSIRKIRGLDKQDDQSVQSGALDAVLKSAYNKLQLTQNNITINTGVSSAEPRIINPKADDLPSLI